MTKGVAALLALVLLSGCSTQRVQFTSVPVGATVIAGKQQGVTPCTLKVPDVLTHATFCLPSGEELVVSLSRLDSDLEEVSEVAGQVVGGTLMFSGYLIGGAGVAAFLLAAWSLDDDDVVEDQEESDTYAIMGVSLLTAVAGLGVVGLGHWIYPDDAIPVVHVEFDCSVFIGTNAPPEDPRFEDLGYGARRLRKVSQ